MAKFRYRMQNILDIKMKLESQAKVTYGLANAAYQEEQKKLQNLLIQRAGYERYLKSLMEGELDVNAINRARGDVNTLKNMVRRQMIEVHKAEKALDAAREELNLLMKERKTQEKLKENDFEIFKHEIAAAEIKEIDELISYTFNEKNEVIYGGEEETP